MEGASGVGGGVVSVSTRMGQFFDSEGRFVEGKGWDGLACLGCSLSHPGRWVKDGWHISCSPSAGVSTGLSPGREEVGVVGKCVDNSLMRSRVCSSLPLR